MFQKDPCLEMSMSYHSPHVIIPSLIKKNSTVLDIGCNGGYIGKVLKEKNVIVDGIDININALKKAKKYYRKTYQRDLYNPVLGIDAHSFYDYIILSDILEHLPRPDLVLIDCRKYLKKSGLLIVSIPNVARFEIRLMLLFGKFQYSNGGILSSDHLRFFTKKTAGKLLNHSGYKVINVIPTGLGHIIGMFTTLTAFQFIFVCKQT